jgi:transposase
MEKELITLSTRELERLRIISKVMDRSMTQMEASTILGITDRQIRNLIVKIREKGNKGIAHGNRGREAPNKMAKAQEERIAEIVKEEYSDFRPTLATEKLRESHGIRLGREKLRQIMIAEGLWKVRKRPQGYVHQWRERKAYLGEMVQMDGSHHDWLEDRGARLVLMGYIDDATNRFFCHFYDYEGIYPAMDSLERYIKLYGLPVSLYLDKHSTYKTTRQPDTEELLRGERARTQFERAVKELGIRVIHANSPQAKGRVERVFGTLQDRLVKEMRLEEISTREGANKFLQIYLPRFNEQFMRVARGEGDLHRPKPEEINLREILCIKGNRTINAGCIIKWRKRVFILNNPSIALRRRKVEVREHFDGEITFKYKERYIDCHEVFEVKPKREEKKEKKAEPKEPHKRYKYTPPLEHPWKKYNYKGKPNPWS